LGYEEDFASKSKFCNLRGVFDSKTIALKTGLSVEEIEGLREE